MKILLCYFFLLNFVVVNSQNFVISRHEKADIKYQGNLFAQKIEFKDTIFVTFNKKLDIKYGKSWHKEIDNSQEIKVWNKFSDSLKIKTGSESSNLNPLILKKKKVYDITDLLDKGVVEYIKIIENKDAFLVEKDNRKQLILFRIENWIFSERPQE